MWVDVHCLVTHELFSQSPPNVTDVNWESQRDIGPGVTVWGIYINKRQLSVIWSNMRKKNEIGDSCPDAENIYNVQ